MYPHKPILALALIVLLSGCSEESTPPAAPFEPEVPAPVAPPVGPVARILHSWDSAFIIGGMRQELTVAVVDAQGKAVPNKLVVWSSSDTTVAGIASQGNCGPTGVPGCYRTSVYGRGDGSSVITATVDGVSADMTVRVRIALADATGIDVNFSVIELAGQTYAPLITVTETTGKRSIEVLALSITIPPGIIPVRCTGSVTVGPGKAVPMFQTDYGDFQLTLGGGPARTSDDALATVYLRDESGAVSKEEVIGKIVPFASWPPTGTQGPDWSCA